jgi:hypothetical protein
MMNDHASLGEMGARVAKDTIIWLVSSSANAQWIVQ